MKKILLIRKIYADAIKEVDGYEIINSFDHEVDMKELEDVEIVIGNVKTEWLKYMPNLRFLQLESAGSDQYAFREEIKNKVVLANSTGCFSDSISEWAIGMILYFYKNLNIIIPNQKKHIYYNPGENKTIYNSRVLILGFGSIGQYTARKLHMLGARVDAVKRTPGIKYDYIENLYTNEKVDEIIGDYDIVFMSLPANDSTYHYMNKKRISRIKDDGLLVNVGRGSCVDEKALIEELKTGRIKACLDVFEKEPLDESSELWDLDNCLITPHATGNEYNEWTRVLLVKHAKQNLDNFLNNRPIMNLVDYSTGYKVSNT